MYVDNKNSNPYGGEEAGYVDMKASQDNDNILKPESQDHSDEAHYHK